MSISVQLNVPTCSSRSNVYIYMYKSYNTVCYNILMQYFKHFNLQKHDHGDKKRNNLGRHEWKRNNCTLFWFKMKKKSSIVECFCHHNYINLSGHHGVKRMTRFGVLSIFTVAFLISYYFRMGKIICLVGIINWQVDIIMWQLMTERCNHQAL